MMMLLLAQNAVDPWRFPPVTVLGWVGFIAIVIGSMTAIVKASRYLISQALEANRWGLRRWKERMRVEQVMSDITSTEGWPNGSHSLKQSHHALYDKVSSIETSVQELTRTVEKVILPMDKE